MNIKSGKQSAPLRCVIYGPEGVGKTTLASQFPSPVFIDLEAGTKSYDVNRVDPAPSTFSELKACIDELARIPSCGTIVIDTADAAEKLVMAAVLEEGGKTGIEEFGYGKGYTYLAEKWSKLLATLSAASISKHIVVCAHSQIMKFETPGQLGNYDRFSLKLAKQLSPMLREWGDMVLFINWESILNKDKDTKKIVGIGGTERVMHTAHRDAFDAKNRHDLADTLPCEFASIAHLFGDAAQRELPLASPGPVVSAPTPPAPIAIAVDDPLAWFAEYETEINVKLLAKGWITSGQTWRDLNAGRKAQLAGTTRAKMAAWCGFVLKEAQ
ncbi:MAG: ATP-binding protein [Opitutaceae bacterium]|jgi:hypothetical protein